MVCFDDARGPTPALDFARTEAMLRGCELIVLHTAGGGAARPDRPDGRGVHRVRHRVVPGDPAQALVSAARQASVVVADRHGADVTATLIGGAARALVRAAWCPVFLIG